MSTHVLRATRALSRVNSSFRMCHALSPYYSVIYFAQIIRNSNNNLRQYSSKAPASNGLATTVFLEIEKAKACDNEHVVVSHINSTVLLTLNRPKNGNALTLEMIETVTSLFKKFSEDEKIHNIIITGNGRFFCTGMDLSASSYASGGKDTFSQMFGLFDTIAQSPKTTVALVNGSCYGGGVGLTFVCDIRIALSPDVNFTLSETKIGFAPATISKYITREWGPSLAREAMLRARPVSSSELLRLGIIQAVANGDGSQTPVKVVENIFTELSVSAPRARAQCKELVASCVWDTVAEKNKIIEKVYRDMMRPAPEAKHALANFRDGKKTINWEEWYGS